MKKKIYFFICFVLLFSFGISIQSADAAANITISSPVLAADGKTLTATLSGGTGTGYSPASGVTGIEVRITDSGGASFTQASATISSNTLTVTLTNSIGIGETVRVNVSASSNLTDSGGNTATGQTSVTTTNSSAITVSSLAIASNLDKIEVAPSGLTGGNVNCNTGNHYNVTANEAYCIEFEANATDISIIYYTQNTAVVSIDAGATTTKPIISPNNYYSADLLSGGTSSAHLVRFQTTGSNALVAYVRLAGGTRQITSVAKTKALYASNVANNTITSAPSPITKWGTYESSGNNLHTGQLGGLIQEFTFNGTGIDMGAVLGVGDTQVFSIDGGTETLTTIGTLEKNNSYSIFQPVSGLTPGSHTARIINPSVGGNDFFSFIRIQNGTRINNGSTLSSGATSITVDSVANLAIGEWIEVDAYPNREIKQITNIVGNVITLNSATTRNHANRAAINGYRDPVGTISTYSSQDLSAKRIVAMGDSNTHGYNYYGQSGVPDANGVYYTQYDTRRSYLWLATQQLGYEGVNLGIQGTDSANQASRAANINTYSRNAFDYLLLLEGTNDINANTQTPSQFKANVITQINVASSSLRAGGRIVLIPVQTPPGVTSGKGLSTTTANQQLADIANDPVYSEDVMYGTALWNGVNLTTYSTSSNPTGDLDGTLHYRPSGQAKLANNLIPLISTTGFTISGPSGGTTGIASTNFTVTRAASTTWNGVDTVTLSDSSQGGLFTPSVGSAATSSVTVTPTASTTSFTFTYTPASTGTKTLSYTNGQGWTNASSTSYVSSAPADVTAPIISSIASSTSQTTALITWTTNEAASSTVRYGTTTSYGSASTSASLVTSHSLSLTGLSANTAYHFEVGGADAAHNVSISTDYVFTTLAIPDTTDPILAEVTPVSTPTSDNTPSYTFSSDEAGTISYGGSCSSSDTVATVGNTTITFNTLSDGTYSNCTITVTDASSNASDPLSVTAFTVDTTVAEPEEEERGTEGRSGGSRRTVSRTTTSSTVTTDTTETQTDPSTPDTGCYPGFVYSTQTGKACSSSVTTTTTVTATTPNPTPSTFTRDLTIGSVGEDVRALQIFLNTHGYPLTLTGPGSPGQETDRFGALTRAALIRFQQANNISPSVGYFGPVTRQFVNR